MQQVNSSGKLIHRTAAAYLKLFLPYFVVLTCGTCKILLFLKLYLGLSLSLTKFYKTEGVISLRILKVSFDMVLSLIM